MADIIMSFPWFLQMNNEDDDWLKESVAGLMHVPPLAR